jgi:hypothetical protein
LGAIAAAIVLTLPPNVASDAAYDALKSQVEVLQKQLQLKLGDLCWFVELAFPWHRRAPCHQLKFSLNPALMSMSFALIPTVIRPCAEILKAWRNISTYLLMAMKLQFALPYTARC